jgi:hypothetical protein
MSSQSFHRTRCNNHLRAIETKKSRVFDLVAQDMTSFHLQWFTSNRKTKLPIETKKGRNKTNSWGSSPELRRKHGRANRRIEDIKQVWPVAGIGVLLSVETIRAQENLSRGWKPGRKSRRRPKLTNEYRIQLSTCAETERTRNWHRAKCGLLHWRKIGLERRKSGHAIKTRDWVNEVRDPVDGIINACYELWDQKRNRLPLLEAKSRLCSSRGSIV